MKAVALTISVLIVIQIDLKNMYSVIYIDLTLFDIIVDSRLSND